MVNCHAVESSSVPLQQQQQQPQLQNHTQNSNRKKSVMLNLKSGAINSVTFEVFGNYSTRFAGGTQRRRKCLLIGGIVLGCLCFFAFGVVISKMFEAKTCKCKWVLCAEHISVSATPIAERFWCAWPPLLVFFSASFIGQMYARASARRQRSLVRTHSRFVFLIFFFFARCDTHSATNEENLRDWKLYSNRWEQTMLLILFNKRRSIKIEYTLSPIRQIRDFSLSSNGMPQLQFCHSGNYQAKYYQLCIECEMNLGHSKLNLFSATTSMTLMEIEIYAKIGKSILNLKCFLLFCFRYFLTYSTTKHINISVNTVIGYES